MGRKKVVDQENRPNRKVFRITEQGKSELRQWLSAPLAPEESRSAGLIQVFFAGQLEDAQILEIFERHEKLLQTVLAAYEQVPGQVEHFHEMVGSSRESFFWMLTLESGFTMVRAQLEWVRDVIHRIKEGQHNRTT